MHYVMPLSFLEKAIRSNGSVLSILISDQTLRWTVWKENFADNVFHSSDRSVVTTFCCGMWKEKKRFEGRKKTFALTEIVFVQIEELNLFHWKQKLSVLFSKWHTAFKWLLCQQLVIIAYQIKLFLLSEKLFLTNLWVK